MKVTSRCCVIFATLAVLLLTALAPVDADQSPRPVLGIHLVHQKYSQFTDPPEVVPEGYRSAPSAVEGERNYVIATDPVLADADFAEVTAGFDQYTAAPVVNFRLTDEAASRFAEVTRENIGRAMAIVIDGRVVSAPIIQSEISGGAGVITGGFSTEEVNDLVARMTGKTAE